MVPVVDQPVKTRPVLIAAIMTTLLISAGVFLGASSVGMSVNSRITDLFWTMDSSDRNDSRVIFIDIDEKSIQTVGPWPWSRKTIADLVAKTRDSGASGVAVDILLPESKEGDQYLARELKSKQVVSAVTFALPGNERIQSGVLPDTTGKVLDVCNEGIFPNAIGYLGVSEQLADALVGHIVPRIDSDGTVRRMPAVVCQDGVAYPSLSVALFSQILGIAEPLSLESQSAAIGTQKYLNLGLSGIQIPLSQRGDITIPFGFSDRSITTIPAYRLLNQEYDLQGAVAVIGSSAVGLSDRVATPLSRLSPGALLHVRTLYGLLDGSITAFSSWVTLIQLAFTGLFTFSLIVWCLIQSSRWSLILSTSALAAGLITVSAYFALGWLRLESHFITSLLVTVGTCLCSLSIGLSRARRERKQIIARFSAYVPQEFAERVASGYQPNSVDMVKIQSIVVAIDLRNFDLWAEKIDASLSAALLHHYASTVFDVVGAHHGQIKNISGSLILAVWPDDSLSSEVCSCVDQLVNEFDCGFDDFEEQKKLPPIALSVGIERGAVLLGTYGASGARGFTLLGEASGVAIGLTRMTGELGWSCLLGPAFASGVGDHHYDSIGTFLIEESERPTEVFRLSSVA